METTDEYADEYEEYTSRPPYNPDLPVTEFKDNAGTGVYVQPIHKGVGVFIRIKSNNMDANVNISEDTAMALAIAIVNAIEQSKSQ
jgi:hypothetical protein